MKHLRNAAWSSVVPGDISGSLPLIFFNFLSIRKGVRIPDTWAIFHMRSYQWFISSFSEWLWKVSGVSAEKAQLLVRLLCDAGDVGCPFEVIREMKSKICVGFGSSKDSFTDGVLYVMWVPTRAETHNRTLLLCYFFFTIIAKYSGNNYCLKARCRETYLLWSLIVHYCITLCLFWWACFKKNCNLCHLISVDKIKVCH